MREALAFWEFCRKYRHYLLPKPFIVRTDHLALKALPFMDSPNGKLARICLELQEYKYQIEYKPGKENFVDALSRLVDIPDSGPTLVNVLSLSERHDLFSVRELKCAQKTDPFCSEVFACLARKVEFSKDFALYERSIESFCIENGVVCFLFSPSGTYRDSVSVVPVIPDSLVPRFLDFHHMARQAGHIGIGKMMKKIRSTAYFPSMYSRTKLHVSRCIDCLKRKPPNRTPSAPLGTVPVATGPMNLVSLDIVGPLPQTKFGNSVILTARCHFTKFVFLLPLPDQKAETVAKALVEKVFMVHGIPNRVLTDNGSNFCSKLMAEVHRLLGISHVTTSPYNPKCNGLIERVHRTLKDALSQLVSAARNDWDEYLPYVQYGLNTAHNEATLETPFFAMYLRDPSCPFPNICLNSSIYENVQCYVSDMLGCMKTTHGVLSERISFSKEKQKLSSPGSRFEPFGPGDIVFLRTPPAPGPGSKLNKERFGGPYRVIRSLNEGLNYEIQQSGSKLQIVHFNRLVASRLRSPWVSEAATSPMPVTAPSPDITRDETATAYPTTPEYLRRVADECAYNTLHGNLSRQVTFLDGITPPQPYFAQTDTWSTSEFGLMVPGLPPEQIRILQVPVDPPWGGASARPVSEPFTTGGECTAASQSRGSTPEAIIVIPLADANQVTLSANERCITQSHEPRPNQSGDYSRSVHLHSSSSSVHSRAATSPSSQADIETSGGTEYHPLPATLSLPTYQQQAQSPALPATSSRSGLPYATSSVLWTLSDHHQPSIDHHQSYTT